MKLEVPEVFRPLWTAPKDTRYLGAWGGRGSGKSHNFADMLVIRALSESGLRAVCLREVQKTLKESAKRLIEDKLNQYNIGEEFDVQKAEIKTPGGGVFIFNGLQDHTADSIKSLEGFKIAWAEEAQTLTARSIELLRPTLRADGSQIWAGWNPRLPTDAIDKLLRGETALKNAAVVRSNWSDNPYFPSVLEEERQQDRIINPTRYSHIWEGEYEPTAVGAIWTRSNLDQHRRAEVPKLKRIVIAIDVAVSNEEESDHPGIVAVGLGMDGRGYVLEDASLKGSPREWAAASWALYEKWDADCFVVERNQGGDMIKHTLLSLNRGNPRVVEVTATKGKHVRAEPISALYDLGQISHVGTFPELETEMVQMTAGGYEGAGSPDRLDALVWGFTELFPRIVRKPKPIPQTKAKNNYRSQYGR